MNSRVHCWSSLNENNKFGPVEIMTEKTVNGGECPFKLKLYVLFL